MINQFFQAYLFSYMFWLGLSLGSLGIAMVHYLMGGRWGVLVRRVAEAAARGVVLMAVLFIPIALGLQSLYPWADPAQVAADPLLQHKQPYLNVPFFLIRAVLYFVIWIGLAFLLTRWSRRPDAMVDSPHRRIFQRMSSIGLIVYIITMTFASVDWMMSLQPHWFSTIYGFLLVMMQALGAMAFALLLLPFLSRRAPYAEVITPDLVRDVGALLFTAVMLWAYMAFSQFLVIWSGNLPHDVPWYIARFDGGWSWVGLLIVFAEFFLPFSILLSLRAKRNLRLVAGLSALILFVNLVDYYWHVIPAFRPGQFSVHFLDILIPVVMGALWLAVFAWQFRRTPFFPLPQPEHPEEPHPRKPGAAVAPGRAAK